VGQVFQYQPVISVHIKDFNDFEKVVLTKTKNGADLEIFIKS
jgi:hypothetical protein